MDGLSAGAGVLAVISLTIQVGKAAQDLVHFFNTITDAPSEVTRLKDQVNRVYTISTAATNALERQRALHGDDVPSAEGIRDTLSGCLRKLHLVEEVIRMVDGAKYGRKAVAWYWSQLRTAIKKQDLVEFERQLGLDLLSLNTLMTANVMYAGASSTYLVLSTMQSLHQVSMQPPTQPSKKPVDEDLPFRTTYNQMLTRLDSAPVRNRGLTMEVSPHDRKLQRTIKSSAYRTWQLGICSVSGQQRTRRWTQKNRPDFDAKLSSHSFHIAPSFSSWALDFFLNLSGISGPSLSLNLSHVVPLQDYEDWLDHMGQPSDERKEFFASDLRDCVARGKCTVSTVFNHVGTFHNVSLFACSVEFESNIEAGHEDLASSWLLQQGYEPKFEDVQYLIESCVPIENILKSTIRLNLTDYDPEDLLVPWTPCLLPSLSQLLPIIHHLLHLVSREDWMDADYLGSLLKFTSCYFYAAENTKALPHVTGVIRSLICQGAYLHTTNRYGRTALGTIAKSLLPGQEHVLERWLALLGDCDVNLADYIVEESLCPHLFDIPVNRYSGSTFYGFLRPHQIHLSLQPIRARMNAWIDPEGSASSLLQELQIVPDVYMCLPPCLNPFVRCIKQENLECSRHASISGVQEAGVDSDRKVDIIGGEREIVLDRYEEGHHCEMEFKRLDLWPLHSAIHTLCGTGSWLGKRCGEPHRTACRFHTCRFNHDRSCRKQEKKIAKRRRAEGRGPRENEIPGAWIE